MYTGGVGRTGRHRLAWRSRGSSTARATNAHAGRIGVALRTDGSSIRIEDDGGGIPVDIHPQAKKSALEGIRPVLHGGRQYAAGNYEATGGVHGVGPSVVDALWRRLVATLKRDGHPYRMTFKPGKPTGSLKKGGAARGTGTTV